MKIYDLSIDNLATCFHKIFNEVVRKLKKNLEQGYVLSYMLVKTKN